MLSTSEEKEFIKLYRAGFLPGKKSIKMTRANLEFLRKDKENNPHHEKKSKGDTVQAPRVPANTSKSKTK